MNLKTEKAYKIMGVSSCSVSVTSAVQSRVRTAVDESSRCTSEGKCVFFLVSAPLAGHDILY